MAVRLTATLDGIKDVVKEIAGLEERARNLRPAFEIVADLLEAHVAAQFATEGAHAGTPWRPLAPATQLQRLRHTGSYRRGGALAAGPTGPILTWTGRTRLSFQAGSPDHVREISERELRWGSRYAVAGYHQRGNLRLPQRKIVAFRDVFQQRELAFQPLRLWLQGVPPGAIRAVMATRLGLGALGARI